MGFFDFFGKTADEQPSGQQNQASSSDAAKPSFDKGNENTFPVAYVRSAKTNINSTKIQVYAQIMNAFSAPIELDKIRIFDVSRELDTVLRSNEVREFLVYDGPQLTREYPEFQLDYKTEEGDYFQAVHDATFTYHPEDKTYTVSNIHVRRPIRDIYG